MALKNYCGKTACKDCESECALSTAIPCCPDCVALTPDSKVNIKKCLEICDDNIKYIFDMVGKSDGELIETYGEIAEYPYDTKVAAYADA